MMMVRYGLVRVSTAAANVVVPSHHRRRWHGPTIGSSLSTLSTLSPLVKRRLDLCYRPNISLFSTSLPEEEEEFKQRFQQDSHADWSQERKQDLQTRSDKEKPQTAAATPPTPTSTTKENDALLAFFEKRRAALLKEKDPNQIQQQQKQAPRRNTLAKAATRITTAATSRTNKEQPTNVPSFAANGNWKTPTSVRPSGDIFAELRNAMARRQELQQESGMQHQQQSFSQPSRERQPEYVRLQRPPRPQTQQPQQQQQYRQRQQQQNYQDGLMQGEQQQQQNQSPFPRVTFPFPSSSSAAPASAPASPSAWNQMDSTDTKARQQKARSRLADLMKHLRRDIAKNPKDKNEQRTMRKPRDQQSQAYQPPLWRQKQQDQQQQQQWSHQGESNRQQQEQATTFVHRRRDRSRSFVPPRHDNDFLHGRGATGAGDHLTTDDATIESAESIHEDQQHQEQRPTITLPTQAMTLNDVSTLFRIKVDDIKSKLRYLGEDKYDIQDEGYKVDVDMMELLAMEYGVETVRSDRNVSLDRERLLLQRRSMSEEDIAVSAEAQPESQQVITRESLRPRPPVVCIMGHVDHGKTTLMDSLRRRSMQPQQQQGGGKKKQKKASGVESKDVAGTEAGGITQIISAFEVAMEGQSITFLDTPGHAAFRSMRQSGSHAADVIVLVVAADDGVSEQTIEILNFYKSIVQGSSDGGISMVVALNKIDKPGIDVIHAKTKVENQLLEHGIITEGMDTTGSEYGPPVQVIPTSGLTGQGLEELMEGLLLQSEVMDLRADNEAPGEGIVMDARIDKGLGAVVDCIMRWGTIKRGDVVVSGTQIGKVRILKDGKVFSFFKVLTLWPELICDLDICLLLEQ